MPMAVAVIGGLLHYQSLIAKENDCNVEFNRSKRRCQIRWLLDVFIHYVFHCSRFCPWIVEDDG